jgi:PAS domain-containing protein
MPSQRSGSETLPADATIRSAADDVVARDRERFLLAVEATGDLIWDWDMARGTVSWAGVTTHYFGRSSGETGATDDPRALWATRVHPDDLGHAEAAARAAFLTGARTWSHEYRFRRVDGSWVVMLERACIVRNAAGAPVRAVGAMQDVTASKTAEAATQRLAAIVASASDAIVGKTTDGIITSWNAAAERLFGYTEGEVLGRSIFMLVPPELHAAERDLLARVRRGERVEYQRPSASARTGAASPSP